MNEPVKPETHHNQKLTTGAARRAPKKESDRADVKVVVLRLDAAEYAAYQKLGGNAGLKALLKEKAKEQDAQT